MAQFRGFTCDSCGEVLQAEQRTRRTVRYDGPAASGEYHEDLCSDCTVVPGNVTLRPLRRRGSRRSKPQPSQETASVG